MADQTSTLAEQQEERPGISPAFIRSVSALVLLIVGTATTSVSVGMWLGPAPGVAILGVVVMVLGFRLSFDE